MNVYERIYLLFITTLKDLGIAGDEDVIKKIKVDLPTEAGHGELSSNAAMILAKTLRQNPYDIALKIKGELAKRKDVFFAIDIAKPGFINLTLQKKIWQQEINTIIEGDSVYGKSNLGNGQEVNLEFVSPNPTGPMHIGHARCAVYGDSLGNILRFCGYNVTKECYVNDYGQQIDILSRSILFRYKELLGVNSGDLPDNYYPGSYVIDAAKKLNQLYNDDLLQKEESKVLAIIKPFAIEEMMKLVKKDLSSLGVVYDKFFYESELHRKKEIDRVVGKLQSDGVISLGVLEKPKGIEDDTWESREQLLFRSTNYGDDTDRALTKKDGSWTYFAADIAYLDNKISRGFKKAVMVLGADHVGFVKRMKALAAALAGDENFLEIKLCQLVSFLQNGQPIKMSKRAGTFMGVQDVLAKVNKDIVRFIMLTRKNNQAIDFDFGKVIEQSKDNPVFYVQYAYARTCSVIRNINADYNNYAENIKNYLNDIDFQLLDSAEEIKLIQMLCYYAKAVESAASAFDPHRIVNYLQNIAHLFHSLWSMAKKDSYFRFNNPENEPLTKARSSLAVAVSIVLASGLKLVGVEPLEKM